MVKLLGIDKIANIPDGLDSTLTVPGHVPLASVGLVVLDSFQLVQPEGVDRILWNMWPAACPLGFARLDLLDLPRGKGADQVDKVMSSTLMGGVFLTVLRLAVVCPEKTHPGSHHIGSLPAGLKPPVSGQDDGAGGSISPPESTG